MIHIQEPTSPWEVVQMDWVAALFPSGDKRYNACLVIVDRYGKGPIFLPCHEDDTDMDTALLLWCRAYHHQTDGLAERMIQALEEVIRRICAYGSKLKDSDGFTHDWCTYLHWNWHIRHQSILLQAKLLGCYKKDGIQRLSADKLRKDWIDIHPNASSFKIMLDKSKHQQKQSMNDAFDYEKQKWDKSHKVPDFKVGDLVLVPTLNFNNIKGPKKLEDSYVGSFVTVALHVTNSVQVELSGELENKNPTFPVSLIKPYPPTDKEFFPLRNPAPLTVPPVEQSEDRKIKKVIKERRLRGKNQIEYLVRYRNPVHEDEWLAESEIPDSDKLLRRFRHERMQKD
ncbi:hypothetical protein O181_027171 [Austropuccinia psidii MF-1]|uniref:Chromo domain-containing protein n=1 Tax=Austropuccinia psidii MF-1 TaxID=1389203 RepID=A0A9Q3CLU6_9BASI|nr:hypothetical protein [Austropuccinia psidii MF-1]